MFKEGYERNVFMKKTGITKMLKGKGLYITVAACAVIIGGAGIFAYNKAVKDISSELTFTPESKPDSSSVSDDSEDPKSLGVSIGIDESLKALTETQPKFMPVPGETILNPFSNGDLVKSETLGIWKTHDGVDIAAPLGTEVKAMTKGTVKEVTSDPMWGNCIVIDHGSGVTAYYCNLSKAMTVKAGDSVDAGDVIGAVGDSAEAEIAMESHIHFALKQNGKWIDPISYINPTDK